MSMADVYQPAIILYLLENKGRASRKELSRVLSGLDDSVQSHYDSVLMRWPKKTLTQHNIVTYDRGSKSFVLSFSLDKENDVETAKAICEHKIKEWISKKSRRDTQTKVEASVRYRILKAARGRCELCGISAKVRAIDIDHIIPKNKADREGFVIKDGISMHMDDERNLQALCFRCNRAKRDQDSTDFRIADVLVRDKVPDALALSDTSVIVGSVIGSQLTEKLFEKLIDEHAELSQNHGIEHIVEMIEILIAIAHNKGYTERETMEFVRDQRSKFGTFSNRTISRTKLVQD